MPNINSKSKGKKQNKQKKGKGKSSNSKGDVGASIGRSILRSLGTLGGGVLGGPSGASAGFSLANHVSNWLGLGDYAVRNNSLVTKPIPSMHKASQSVVVRHREYIGDVLSSSIANAFKSVSYPLNPGLATSFPWLSSIAQNYQEYTFKGAIYEFHSASADAIASSTNTTLGTVQMVTLYRNSIAFTSKQQVLNEFFANDAKPSEDFVHPVECDPNENPFKVQYVRGGPIPSGEDLKMYDLGTFYICSSGVQGTSVNLGELWVTYEVELKKPVMLGIAGGDVYGPYAHYNTTPITASPIYGWVRVADNIGLTNPINTSQIWFPNGTNATYMITMLAYGVSATCAAPTLALSPSGAYATGTITTAGTAMTQFVLIMFVTFTASPGQDCWVSYSSNGSYPTATTGGSVYVNEIPSPYA